MEDTRGQEREDIRTKRRISQDRKDIIHMDRKGVPKY